MESVDCKEREALFDAVPAARGRANAVGEEYQPTVARAGTGSKHDVHLETETRKARLWERSFRAGERPRPADSGTASQDSRARRSNWPSSFGTGFFRECLAADQGDN